jgi:hypothetical protein
VVVLTLLSVGRGTNAYLSTLMTGSASAKAFVVLGSFYALPCAALCAGLLLRWRGIAVVLVLWALFLIVDGLMRAGFDVSNLQLALNSDGAASPPPQ